MIVFNSATWEYNNMGGWQGAKRYEVRGRLTGELYGDMGHQAQERAAL